MTTFNSKKTSFITYDILSDIDTSKMEVLRGFPLRNITNEPIVEEIFFTTLTDIDSSNIEIDRGFVSFCLVSEKKRIPKHKINKEIEKAKEEYVKLHKISGEIPTEEEDEIRSQVIKTLAVGQHPNRTTCGVILDIKNKKLFIERKGWLTDLAFMKLNTLCGVLVKNWVPFTQVLINNIPVRTLFLQWLYLSMEKAKIELTVNSDLKLSNNIKLYDDDTKIAVKGNIIKFLDVYKKLMTNAKVEECTVKITDKVNRDYEYTLKIADMCIHGFTIKGQTYGYEDDYSLSVVRSEEFMLLINHINNLARIFEKDMI